MNTKRLVVAWIVVYVVGNLLDFLIHGVIMRATYESAALKPIWRPDMESKMWIMYVIGVITWLLFVYIFVRGYENRGLAEGVRYGIIMGLFVGLPFAYGSYVMIPIPYSLALQWFIYTFIEMIVAGVVVAAIYKPPLPR